MCMDGDVVDAVDVGGLGSRSSEERLRWSLEVSRLPAAEFVAAMLPSMFS
jgi:hypothetical protein